MKSNEMEWNFKIPNFLAKLMLEQLSVVNTEYLIFSSTSILTSVFENYAREVLRISAFTVSIPSP
jgi:hypothetical protein